MKISESLYATNGAERFTLLISLLFAAGIAAVSICTQPLIDDWIYKWSSGADFYDFWHCKGPEVNGFTDALRSCWHHYCHSNGRLTDKLLIIFSLFFPAWMAKGICVGSMWTGLVGLLRMTTPGGRLPSPLTTALICWTILFFFPWNDYITTLSCCCNYLLPLGFCIPVIQWFTAAGKGTPAQCLVSFLAGMMHESIGLGILAGMGTLLLLRRFRLTGGQWRISLWFLAGLLILMLAPGTFVRMNDANTGALNMYWISGTITMIPLILTGMALSCLYFMKSCRKKVADAGGRDTLIMLGMTALGSLAVAFLSLSRGRAFWFADFVGTGYIFLTLNLLKPGLLARGKSIAAILTVLMCAELTWCAFTQHKYAVAAEKLTRPGATQWMDVTDYTQLNPWQLGLTIPPMPDIGYAHVSQRYYFQRVHPKYFYAPLPEEFRGQPYTQWDTLPMQPGLYGRYPFFYVPDYVPGKDREHSEAIVSFDVEHAPLSPCNWLLKLRGVKRRDVAINADILRMPLSEMPAAERHHFANPATGRTPDTLTFFYLFKVPRPLQYAPVLGRRR